MQHAKIKPFTISRSLSAEAGNQNWRQHTFVVVKTEINILVGDNKEVE